MQGGAVLMSHNSRGRSKKFRAHDETPGQWLIRVLIGADTVLVSAAGFMLARFFNN